MVSDFEYYGRVAFEAYRLNRSGMNHDGSRTPEWEELGDDIQQAWIVAGEAVVKAYQGE